MLILTSIFALSLLLVSAIPASSYMVLIGHPTVIDANTLELSGERIRLVAIDAPETKQPCADAKGHPSAAVGLPRQALRETIGRLEVRWIAKSRGRYGRFLRACYLGEESLPR